MSNTVRCVIPRRVPAAYAGTHMRRPLSLNNILADIRGNEWEKKCSSILQFFYPSQLYELHVPLLCDKDHWSPSLRARRY
jgi:hypothetical protein